MCHPTGRFRYGDSYFEYLAAISTPSFLVSRRRFPSGFREAEHEHNRPYVQAIISGSLLESGLSYSSGMCGYQPAGSHESVIDGDGLDILVIELTGEHECGAAPFALKNAGGRGAVATILNELAEPDGFSNLAVEGASFELLAYVARTHSQERHAPRWLAGVAECVRERDEASIEELARVAGVHPSTLTRAFRRHYRMSIAEYVRTAKLERALALLRTSDLSIGEIAAECGFVDQSHFTRRFRAKYGGTPGQFRSTRTIHA